MRLITHNLLKCNIRGLTADQGYPLRIEADKVDLIDAEFNIDFIKTMLKKTNWKALSVAATCLGLGSVTFLGIEDITDENREEILNNEELLREVHHLLFEVHVQDGWLVCPTTKRKFPVKDGIPNMLLHEDEV